MGKHKASKSEREDNRARRESRRYGYEYRPGALKQADEARRIDEGFRMLDENSYDETDDDE